MPMCMGWREGGKEEGRREGRCWCKCSRIGRGISSSLCPRRHTCDTSPIPQIPFLYLRHVHLPVSQHRERFFHGLEGMAHIQGLGRKEGTEGGMEGGREGCECMDERVIDGRKDGLEQCTHL